MLASLEALLDGHPGFTVVGKAQTGAELLALMGTQPTDMVLAEPWLRSNDGLEALTSIRDAYPEVTIVALSRLWDARHVQQLRDIGARAYIPKSTDLRRVPPILHQACDGMETFPADDSPGRQGLLTTREAEVLRLAADGLDNQAIADQLFVTERTVKFHLQNAYRKLGVGNRTAAAAVARRQGLIS